MVLHQRTVVSFNAGSQVMNKEELVNLAPARDIRLHEAGLILGYGR
jgi:hypothetical protein